jgi:3-hydroxyisobutyrate dehydrogenase-like beta-hydroxyacid dehydrogenase
MTAVGFVGPGAMGGRIAGRLLEGNEVYGTNRTASRASGLTGRGLIWRDTPREVAQAAEVIFSMVTDDAALEVLARTDGAPAGVAGPARNDVAAAGDSRIGP